MPGWLGLVVLIAASAAGCHVQKDPLRAPWLLPGFYPPPAPARAVVLPTGLPPAPVDVVASAPGFLVDAWIEMPGLGRIEARVYRPGAVGRVHVSPAAPAPVRVLDAPLATTAVPGFVFGVDLTPYRSIAIVIDTASWVCAGLADRGSGPPPSAPRLLAMADQLAAVLEGVRLADARIAILSGADDHLRRLWIRGQGGRQLATAWLAGTVCAGHRAIAPLLVEAFATQPDVVVVISDGAAMGHEERAFAISRCRERADELPCRDPAEVAQGSTLKRPVIAVSVTVPESEWMRSLADVTGGAYVYAGP
jgi:hypothetical protein